MTIKEIIKEFKDTTEYEYRKMNEHFECELFGALTRTYIFDNKEKLSNPGIMDYYKSMSVRILNAKNSFKDDLKVELVSYFEVLFSIYDFLIYDSEYEDVDSMIDYVIDDHYYGDTDYVFRTEVVDMINDLKTIIQDALKPKLPFWKYASSSISSSCITNDNVKYIKNVLEKDRTELSICSNFEYMLYLHNTVNKWDYRVYNISIINNPTTARTVFSEHIILKELLDNNISTGKFTGLYELSDEYDMEIKLKENK